MRRRAWDSVAVCKNLRAEGDTIDFLAREHLAGLVCRGLLHSREQDAIAREAVRPFLDDRRPAGAGGIAKLGLCGLQGLLRPRAVSVGAEHDRPAGQLLRRIDDAAADQLRGRAIAAGQDSGWDSVISL